MQQSTPRLVAGSGAGKADASALRARVAELETENARLRKGEARYRTLAEAIGAVVWITAPDGRVDDMPQWRALTGQTVAENQGWGWLDAIHPEDRSPTAEAWRRAVDARGPCDVEYRVRNADGRYRWYNARSVPVHDADGFVREWVGTCIDIDDRRRAEAARAEGERRYRELAEALGVAIYITDAEGRLTSYNDAAAELWGWRPPLHDQQWCGSWRLYRPDGTPLPHDECPMAVTLRENRPVRGAEATAERPDGTRVPFIPYPTPLHDAQGELVGAVNVLVDITERKAAEAALAESEARLRDLLATLDLGASMARDLDGTIRFWSEGCARLYGWTVAEALGRDAHALLHTTFPVPSVEIEAALEHDGEWTGDLRQWTRDGKELVVVARKLLRRGPDGGPVAVLEALGDVTAQRQAEAALAQYRDELEHLVEERTVALLRETEERRRAEEAMRQSEKLAALGQLTGGVAHDFGNLLQVISSGAALLGRPGVPEGRKAVILEGMIQAGQRGRELTHRLLAFARQQPLHPKTFDLNARLVGMSELLRQTLGSGDRVEIDFAPDLWLVHADPGQLEVAVLNLAINARDAMPDGGTLTLQTRNATLGATDERPAGEYVCLAVTDTGQGMPPAVLARVFEPFFTTKESGKGTGLGLPQVFGFAKQSGGDITIESTPGEGTTVVVHLPRVEAAQAASRTEAAGPGAVLNALRSSEGKVVLVVEDNAAAGDFAAELLQELGYATRRADSAAGALAMLADGERVDAVFSDVMMPGGMSGAELAVTLCESYPHVAVVLTSGYGIQPAQGEAPRVETLAKPYQLGELAAALERALAAVVAAQRGQGGGGPRQVGSGLADGPLASVTRQGKTLPGLPRARGQDRQLCGLRPDGRGDAGVLVGAGRPRPAPR